MCRQGKNQVDILYPAFISLDVNICTRLDMFVAHFRYCFSFTGSISIRNVKYTTHTYKIIFRDACLLSTFFGKNVLTTKDQSQILKSLPFCCLRCKMTRSFFVNDLFWFFALLKHTYKMSNSCMKLLTVVKKLFRDETLFVLKRQTQEIT